MNDVSELLVTRLGVAHKDAGECFGAGRFHNVVRFACGTIVDPRAIDYSPNVEVTRWCSACYPNEEKT